MLKIVACAIICAFILTYLKSVGSEFFSVAVLGAGVILTSLGIEYLTQTVEFVRELIEQSGVNTEYFSIILKITGIAYVVEFGAGIVEDMGLKSVADKLVFVGKIAIFVTAMPIIYAVFNLMMGLVK
ncbi:MAG: stage III sporulation protein AD [Clostridia bacterium]|nr:stage III sporulation protein AD [Clostridia bacterium]